MTETILTDIMKENPKDLVEYACVVIKESKLKLDSDFIKTFMFALDSKEEYPIDINLLVEWKVDSRKDNAKKRLYKYFTESIDFCVKKIAPELSGAITDNKKGGHNIENIYITTDCFKAMCMLANNEIGRKVRGYYLTLEKIFKQYLEHKSKQIINEKQNVILDKNRVIYGLKHNLNSIKVRHNYHKFKDGACFYIVCNDNGNIKIGETDNINDRLKDYRTSDPLLKIKYLVYTNFNKIIEKCILNKYNQFLLANSHEVIKGQLIDYNEIIISVTYLINFLKVDHTIEIDLHIYNNDIDLTEKNSIIDQIFEKHQKRDDIINTNNTDNNNIKKKVCGNCNINKYITEFYTISKKNTNPRHICKKCSKLEEQEYKKRIKENPLNFRKECIKCKNILSFDMFYKNNNNLDKLTDKCIQCHNQDNNILNMKQCNKCEKIQSYSFFHKDSTKPDKHSTRCKKCRNTSEKNLRPIRKNKIIK